MNRIKGLALGLGVTTLIVVGLACGAGKTPAGSDELDTGDGQMEIAQALQAAEGSQVTVSGHLIADTDGITRLCSVLAESLSPQCGGDVIHLLGFDASSVPNSKTPPGPSDIQTARWTDSYITVTGIKGRRGLAEVRLSSEPAADSTDVPVVTSAASQGREQIRCFPTGLAARVGASVGDSWTLAGNIRLQGKIPPDPRDLRNGGESSVTFTLTGLDDGSRTWLVDEASGKRSHIENSEASVHTTTVYRDDEGNTLEATERNEKWATFVIHGSDQALITPDWDCHRNAWLTGGIPSSRDITRESSVGEIDLPTRSIVLFIETTAWAADSGDEFAAKSVYGYDKVTGRLVLTERHQSGTLDGRPYTLDMVRELVPALTLSGISIAPLALAPAVTGMIVPDLRLTFEGVEYSGVEVLSAASPTGPVMCCGTPIKMDDMEVVGAGTSHNPDGDASVKVYRPKAGATTDLYTSHQTIDASGEPGGTATGPATWTRWAVDVATPAPAAEPVPANDEKRFS